MTDDGPSPATAQAQRPAGPGVTSRVSRTRSPSAGLPPPRRHARRRHHLMSLREWLVLAVIGVLAAFLVVVAVIALVAH
ncbi:MAG: hypothetical protein ABSA40_01360 [Candidatus Dormibacteria bacterium]